MVWMRISQKWLNGLCFLGIKLASCVISLVLPAGSICWRYISVVQCLVSFGCSGLLAVQSDKNTSLSLTEKKNYWKTSHIIFFLKTEICLRIKNFSAWQQEINIWPVRLESSSPLPSVTAVQRGINAVWNSPSELAAAICQIKRDCQSLLAGRHRARSSSWCLLLAFVCSVSSYVLCKPWQTDKTLCVSSIYIYV